MTRKSYRSQNNNV